MSFLPMIIIIIFVVFSVLSIRRAMKLKKKYLDKPVDDLAEIKQLLKAQADANKK